MKGGGGGGGGGWGGPPKDLKWRRDAPKKGLTI